MYNPPSNTKTSIFIGVKCVCGDDAGETMVDVIKYSFNPL